MSAQSTATGRVAKLSPRSEFNIVVLAAFGLFIATSAVETLHVSARISESMLRLMLAYELVAGLALIGLLRARGWTAVSLGASPTFSDSIVGLGLAIATLLSIVLLLTATAKLFPGLQLSPESGFIAGHRARRSRFPGLERVVPCELTLH